MVSSSLAAVMLGVTTAVLAHQQQNAFQEFQEHNHGLDSHGQPTDPPPTQVNLAAPIAKDEEQQQQQQHSHDHDAHIRKHEEDLDHLNLDDMTPSERQYHLFMAHDHDHDLSLDGVEIMQVLFHESEQLFSDEELSGHIDVVLSMYDTNRDGKLSFPEFMVSVNLPENTQT